MSTWYLCIPGWGGNIGGKIDPVEVERFTDSSVFRKGHRYVRITTFECYYPTWQEAKNAIVQDKERKLDNARKNLERALSDLDLARKISP